MDIQPVRPKRAIFTQKDDVLVSDE
jgi:hypothetical protein